MSKKQFIKRHLLIINKLKRTSCNFEELQKYLLFQSELDEEKYTLSIRTLQRDIAEIQSLYDIEIKYNRKDGVYEIINDQEDALNHRILETFTVLNTLKMAENFSDEIVFEQRKSLGLEHIFLLVHSIKNNQEISFLHKKYWESLNSKKTIQPYFVKESKNRWYLIGLDKTSNQMKTFGLDRISEIELLKTKFKKPPKKFLKSLFENSFGIIYEESLPQKIILEFSSFQASYIKSLPLHKSQKILSENENTCLIELNIHPTYDFVMEILSFGKEVKVVEPQIFKENIKQILVDSLKNY